MNNWELVAISYDKSEEVIDSFEADSSSAAKRALVAFTAAEERKAYLVRTWTRLELFIVDSRGRHKATKYPFPVEYMSQLEATLRFDETLDKSSEQVSVNGYVFAPSEVLKAAAPAIYEYEQHKWLTQTGKVLA